MRNRLEGRWREIGMKSIIIVLWILIALLLPLYIKDFVPFQSVPHALSASSPSSLIATEQEVRQFFDQYIERYNKMDIDGFLWLFSLKAKQNQQDGLPEIRMIYADFFNQSLSLQNSIEDMKIEIFQNAVEFKARYTVNQVLKERGEKRIWKGNIRWVLVKEEGNLKIISIDFRHSMSPTPVLEREPRPREEPAGKAVVKSEISVEGKKAIPQSPPLLAKEEEVKRFFSDYTDQYNRKDIKGFLSFFSSRAVQNQKDGLPRIKEIYTNFFDQSRALRFRMEDRRVEIYENAVEVQARYEIEQVMKRSREIKVWKGQGRWVLIKENEALKILFLDYQLQRTP
jgi:ketosteroid isomerase-like protein